MKDEITGVVASEYLETATIKRILGLKEDIPLSIDDMKGALKVTFYQVNPVSEFMNQFYDKLCSGFKALGVEVVDFKDALDDSNKVKPNTTVVVAGMTDDPKDMMVNHVSSLYSNPIVALYERDSPVNPEDSNQDKLDSIISVLAYDVVHMAIFVNDKNWTICTMNGAIVPTPHGDDICEAIENCLIPKLAAQIVPPHKLSNIDFRYDKFDPQEETYTIVSKDLKGASLLLQKDGLIMSHTKVSSINFKNKFHERVVNAYLDHRSGMSYGFMTWQLPVTSFPAMLVDPEEKLEKLATNTVNISFLDKDYLVEIPDVSVVATRSGCDKNNLDISKDIVCLSLSDGKIILDLPVGTGKDDDVKPSYDTLAILAHAVGNTIVSSLLKTIIGENPFSTALDNSGLALFHWHGYLSSGLIPPNHFTHGEDNPSVSCSTNQSAIYSLTGKLEALAKSMDTNLDFLGDIHIEPHHGTNISSTLSLSEIVDYLHKRLN